MITLYWVLWFTITVVSGQTAHFPVDNQYASQAECEADIPEWEALIQSQFPNDENVNVYCEVFDLNLPTKEL
jgi:hypothetical protein